MNKKSKLEKVYGADTLLLQIHDVIIDDGQSTLARAIKDAGHDQSARRTINEMRAWGKTVAWLAQQLERQ